jgi:hypothetical protein
LVTYPALTSRRIWRAVLASLLVLAAVAAWSVPFGRSRPLTPFVPARPPQLALGDFDGDGRLDEAGIHTRLDGRTDVSLRLSSSAAVVQLDAPVAALADGDVDHDGDLDLIAATASGDVVIWLNDGHGRFMRQPASPVSQLLSEPSVDTGDGRETIAVVGPVPMSAAGRRAVAPLPVSNRPLPVSSLPSSGAVHLLRPLRAPPAILSL